MGSRNKNELREDGVKGRRTKFRCEVKNGVQLAQGAIGYGTVRYGTVQWPAHVHMSLCLRVP